MVVSGLPRRLILTRSDRKSTRLNSSHVEISYAVHRDLHSFPTRRSSDLRSGEIAAETYARARAICRNRDLAALRRAFALAVKQRRISSAPQIDMLQENNGR